MQEKVYIAWHNFRLASYYRQVKWVKGHRSIKCSWCRCASNVIKDDFKQEGSFSWTSAYDKVTGTCAYPLHSILPKEDKKKDGSTIQGRGTGPGCVFVAGV